ncbi:MAG: acyl-CoA carboxylase subunit beta, partial [Mycobacteriales bacterium]
MTGYPGGALRSTVDVAAAEYRQNREASLAKLDELATAQAKALAGGGPKYVDRHRGRGKLLARERIE